MKSFSKPLLACLFLAPALHAAPEIPEIVPKQVPRAAAPLVIEDHRFAIDLHKKIKAQGRVRLRWTLVEKPQGATVTTHPDARILEGGETAREIVGFEVDRTGTYTIGIEAMDSTGSAHAKVTVEVKNPLRLLTKALPPAVAGQPYAVRVFAQGGTAPLSYALEGRLPPGLSFAGGQITGTPASASDQPVELTLTVSDAAGASESAPLPLSVSRDPLPWGMLNIGSSFTPHDDPLRAAAAHLGWDAHGWRLDRGGTLGVGIGYAWNNDPVQRWRMLDALRSGRFGSLFLHQGTPWSNANAEAANGQGELTDLGALEAFVQAAREAQPLRVWPVYFNAYWHTQNSNEKPSGRTYYTSGDERDATILYYEGSLLQAREASQRIQQPVFIIPIGPVMEKLRRLIREGKLPSLPDVWDLYSGDGTANLDGGHLSEVGNTVFAQTYFAQTYRLDPRTLPFVYKKGLEEFALSNTEERKPGKMGKISAEDSRLIQAVIHDALTRDPFSGFTPPTSLEAYLAAIDQRLGTWENFNTLGGEPESGSFTGRNGRTWKARNARAAQGRLDLATGGELSTEVDQAFDLLFIETTTTAKDADWSLEIRAKGKVLATLPQEVPGPLAGLVSRWVVKDLRASLPASGSFTLTLHNTGSRTVTLDNLKLRRCGEHGWMLLR